VLRSIIGPNPDTANFKYPIRAFNTIFRFVGQLLVSRVTGHVFDPRGVKSHLDDKPVNRDLA